MRRMASQYLSRFTRLMATYNIRFRYGRHMDIGYARVSTTHQDLERQVDALERAGIPADRIYVDRKSGRTVDRPGLNDALAYARDGDCLVVYTLDRLGRTVQGVLTAVSELKERGVGVRTLADPLPVNTATSDPMAEVAMIMLLLFAQMEVTFSRERAAHARAVAISKGRKPGRKTVVDPQKLAYAAHLRDLGKPMSEVVAATGIARATLYRHMPRRPELAPTASGTAPSEHP
jgi:DNA invertase Pin-like site-specific DNA recombinase